MQKIFVKGSMIIISLIITLFSLEAIIRVMHLLPVSDYSPIYDRSSPHHFKPNASMQATQAEFSVKININSAGYRDKEFSLFKDAATTRIALVGDSFTFGTGVSFGERSSDLLEKLLRKSGHKVETFSFGIPDTETEEHTYLLSHEIARYHPDIVLLMFYVGNDIIDNLKVQQGVAKSYTHQSFAVQWIQYIRNHSQLVRFLELKAFSIPLLRRMYNYVKSTSMMGEVGEQMSIFDTTYKINAPLWQSTFHALKHFSSTARRLGIPESIVLLPTRIQYDRDILNSLLERNHLDARHFRVSRPNDLICAFVQKQLRAPCWDALPAFTDAAKSHHNIYFPVNGHWTPLGHRIMAEFLAKKLANETIWKKQTATAISP